MEHGWQWTPKRRRFIEEYLVDCNASAAARRAGYSGTSVDRIGRELLAEAPIQAALQQAMDARSAQTGITAERVLREIARLAFVDPRKLYAADGSLKPIPELDDDTAAAIAGWDVTEELGQDDDGYAIVVGKTKKPRLWNKTENLKLLGQHLKMFVERVQHEGEVAITLVERARQANERIARLRRGSQE